MIDPELMEQFQLLFTALEQTKAELRTEIHESETRTKVFIENNVSKRMESLFDGFKLTHEKQWEMDRETERLKQKIEDLQIRLEVLESKVAGD